MFRVSKWLKEPLFHFCVLGSVIFWLSGIAGQQVADIVVTAGLKKSLAADFERKHGLAPIGDQLSGLVAVWIDDEMLYREARRLGLDESDPVMRRRLIQSMRFLAEDEASSVLPQQSDLESVLAANPDQFKIAPTVSFEHMFFRKGSHTPAAIAQILGRLKKGEPVTGGDPFIHGRELLGVTQARVKTLLGEAFTKEVFAQTPGIWRGPVVSSFGSHLVLVKARTKAQVPELQAVANQVSNVWRNNKRSEALAKRLDELRQIYVVRDASESP